MKHHRLIIALAAAACLWGGTVPAFASTLVWQTSKTAAVSMALEQGKRILFLAGYNSCSHCSTMKNTVCESVSPPVKSLIEQHYIPWYCNTQGSCWDDYSIYSAQTSEGGVPLLCVINPKAPDTAVSPFRGEKSAEFFYSWLYDNGPAIDLAFLADAIAALQALARMPTPDIDVDDIDGDQKIGLAEAIYFLQKAAMLR